MTCKKTIKLSQIIIPKYYPIISDTKHMHECYTSGRAGTKSSAMGIASIYEILNVPNTAVVIMRKNHNKLRRTVYQEVIRAMKRLGLKKNQFIIHVSPMEIIYKKNGNIIIFTGSDSIDDTKGIIAEDKKIRLVVLDELTEFFDKGEGEEEINNIVATFVRGNDDIFRVLYLFNPPKNSKAPIMKWLEKMETRDDFLHVHSDYRDVPVEWLGSKLIQEAEAMKKADEKMYNWVWLGKSIGLEGIIYYMFNREKHIVDDLNKIYNMYIVGVDYGQMNATTYQVFGINFKEKKMTGLDEFYHSGRDSGHQKSPSDYAKEFEKLMKKIYNLYGKKVTYVCIDPSAKGLSEEIKRLCPYCNFPKTDNTVSLGITRVQKMLSYEVISLSSNQKNLIEEIETYHYDDDALEKGIEKPVEIDDHGCDALRYAVMQSWKTMCHLLPLLKADEKED